MGWIWLVEGKVGLWKVGLCCAVWGTGCDGVVWLLYRGGRGVAYKGRGLCTREEGCVRGKGVAAQGRGVVFEGWGSETVFCFALTFSVGWECVDGGGLDWTGLECKLEIVKGCRLIVIIIVDGDGDGGFGVRYLDTIMERCDR